MSDILQNSLCCIPIELKRIIWNVKIDGLKKLQERLPQKDYMKVLIVLIEHLKRFNEAIFPSYENLNSILELASCLNINDIGVIAKFAQESRKQLNEYLTRLNFETGSLEINSYIEELNIKCNEMNERIQDFLYALVNSGQRNVQNPGIFKEDVKKFVYNISNNICLFYNFIYDKFANYQLRIYQLFTEHLNSSEDLNYVNKMHEYFINEESKNLDAKIQWVLRAYVLCKEENILFSEALQQILFFVEFDKGLFHKEYMEWYNLGKIIMPTYENMINSWKFIHAKYEHAGTTLPLKKKVIEELNQIKIRLIEMIKNELKVKEIEPIIICLIDKIKKTLLEVQDLDFVNFQRRVKDIYELLIIFVNRCDEKIAKLENKLDNCKFFKFNPLDIPAKFISEQTNFPFEVCVATARSLFGKTSEDSDIKQKSK